MTVATTVDVEEPQWSTPSSGWPRSQRRFLFLVTVAFIVLCTAPYAVAALRTPAGSAFSGVLLNHFDQNYYQSSQRSAADDLPRENRFTAELGAPGPVAPLYPLLGLVQRHTGLPAGVTYHLPRILAVACLPAMLTCLFGVCFPGRRDLIAWSVLFTLFTSGVLTLAPWLPFAQRSGETIPESNAMFSLTVFPHFAVSYVGVTLAFTALAMALRVQPAVRIGWVAAAAGLLLALGHTFLLLPVALVLSVLVLGAVLEAVRHRSVGPEAVGLVASAMVFVPAAPFVLELRREQARLQELQQALFPSARADSWWTWALGYGVVTVLAVGGLARLVRSRDEQPVAGLLILWIVVQFGLIYLPLTIFRRRFSEGLIIPLAALAAFGLARLGRGTLALRLRQALLVLLLLGSVTIANVLSSTGQYLDRPYLSLLEEVEATDVVLAGRLLSPSIPAFSPGTVHAARPVETLHYREKRRREALYAADPASPAARQWLLTAGITLVVEDDQDPTFSLRGLDDPRAACLEPFFQRPRLRAYRVQGQCLEAMPPG